VRELWLVRLPLPGVQQPDLGQLLRHHLFLLDVRIVRLHLSGLHVLVDEHALHRHALFLLVVLLLLGFVQLLSGVQLGHDLGHLQRHRLFLRLVLLLLRLVQLLPRLHHVEQLDLHGHALLLLVQRRL